MGEIYTSIAGVRRRIKEAYTSVGGVRRALPTITAGIGGVVRTVWTSGGGGGGTVEIRNMIEDEWFDGYTQVVFLVNADVQIEMRRTLLTWSGEASGYAQEFSYYGSNWFRVEGDDEHVYEVTWWDMPYVVATRYQIVS